MDIYLEENTPVFKKNFYLRDHLQVPYVSKKLKDPKVRNQLIQFVGKLISDNSEALSAPGPMKQILFTKDNIEFLYEVFSVDDKILLDLFKQLIEETYYGNLRNPYPGFINEAPYRLLLGAILIDAIQNEYDDMIEVAKYLWIFSIYPVLFKKQYPNGVKEDVMLYTIDNLQKKSLIKKVKTIQDLYKHDIDSTVNNKFKELEEGVDNVYLDIIQRFRSQIFNKLKLIATAYYANNDMNSSQHSQVSIFDDGTINDQQGQASAINKAVENAVTKLSLKKVMTNIIPPVAEKSHCKAELLEGCINDIFQSPNNRLYEFVETVITVYFNKFPTETSVNTKQFLNFGLALYKSIGTSGNELYQEILEILNYWVNDLLNLGSKYRRANTVKDYRRGIYNYFIWAIKYYNNN